MHDESTRTWPTVLCPVCQADALDPPKACEFCPDSVVEAIAEIEQALERLAAVVSAADRVPGARTRSRARPLVTG